METLTVRRLNRATLARQMLLAREKTDVVTAVERLGGMQAQEPRHPFTGLWTRVDGFRREDLHRALHGRSVARAMMMRATLHLVSAADYARFRPALDPVLAAALSGRGELAAGLDLDRLLPAAREILAEGPRDFTALRALLQERFPEANDRALGYAVRTRLPLVMVPTGDRWAFPPKADFALAESWLAEDSRAVAPGEPVEELVLRYLAAYGPATAADAQTWSGIKGLRAVLDRLRPRLAAFRDEKGRELFDLPGAPRPEEDEPAPARFLPDFDNLVLAHADRTRLMAEEHRGRVTTKNLRVRATFLWDGSVRGTWQAELKRRTAVLHLAAFEPLPEKAVSELAEEGRALLRFLEPDATAFDVRVGDA
ncbi:winged helix DNA-binding domain-containing protein [Planomonospora sp. ID67723]|uniref:winged helix DNA-binding domain-containing protein n=1 Tax=Planomonospora sp. ID67723 TaxID=2738134 RepID=UPI0018C3CDAA|nr:winged helix DNA-binding domain-containing protein [Planomonospora sp. ID67723]MBG0832872.1 winged helix DNA-binding domain-containing protein [Planomonospora sp. ID67723]